MCSPGDISNCLNSKIVGVVEFRVSTSPRVVYTYHEPVDDTDGACTADCGDLGEPVCTWQQVRDLGATLSISYMHV